MSNRRSGIDRRSGWRAHMTVCIERALEAGLSEDEFLNGCPMKAGRKWSAILSVERPRIRSLFREIVARQEAA